jgi:hypothetical protein
VLAAERNSGYRGSPATTPPCAAPPSGRPPGDGLLPDGRRRPVHDRRPGHPVERRQQVPGGRVPLHRAGVAADRRIKPANDFKQMSTYRLTGANKFEKVAPGGEIKHGTLSELTYTNQVDTYGKMLGIDRRDIRNDDLGAFTGRLRRAGPRGRRQLNEVFWTEWLDDATFFPTDKSNATTTTAPPTRPVAGGPGQRRHDLQRPDQARRHARWASCRRSCSCRGCGHRAEPDERRSHGGRPEHGRRSRREHLGGHVQVVPSRLPQLRHHRLLGDRLVPAGRPEQRRGDRGRVPRRRRDADVETGEFDFDRLGLAMRAYMDWGCKKQEYRAASSSRAPPKGDHA